MMPYDRYGRWQPGYQGPVEYGQPDMWGLGPADEEDGEENMTHRTFGPYGAPIAPRPYQRGERLQSRVARRHGPGGHPIHSHHYPYYGYGYGGYGQFGGGYGGELERVAYTSGGPYVGVGPKGYARLDERIREDVNEALTQDAWLDPSDVEARIENGVVTLTGTVESRYGRRLAAEDVWHVAGVREVHNELRVVASARTGEPPSETV